MLVWAWLLLLASDATLAFNTVPFAVPSFDTKPSAVPSPPFSLPAKDSYFSSKVGKEPVSWPWFPMSRSDLDYVSGGTLDAGAELEADHPGFHDHEYRERRRMIAERAAHYQHGHGLPHVDYTGAEDSTWREVYGKLKHSAKQHAVSSYNEILHDMERNIGFGVQGVPQIGDVSRYLTESTGFSLRPVAGLMSPRDFLNGLAFKIFHSTQYIRHHSRPLYTPEPDVIHELVGHAPMLADPSFADLSQRIGLASLGASDFEIKRLSTAYWFSVEFGLCREGGRPKAYGAGLLSSVGELEYACGGQGGPEYRDWDPAAASLHDYPITTYQPLYWVAESLEDAERKIAAFGESLSSRPFRLRYDEAEDCIWTDKQVQREPPFCAL